MFNLHSPFLHGVIVRKLLKTLKRPVVRQNKKVYLFNDWAVTKWLLNSVPSNI